MKQSIYGKVTAADIARGVPHDCGACPVALSVASYGKPGLVVRVEWGHIGLTIGKHVILFRQPENISKLIYCFDDGFPVNPITWSITGYGLDKYFKDVV